MEDKILTIDRIEDVFDDHNNLIGKQCFSGEDSVKVKNPRGTGLKERWGELQVGRAYIFKMALFNGKYPYVQGFEAMEGALPPPVTPSSGDTPDNTKPAPAPQAVGMCTKELGDMIRAKYLKPLFGDEAYIELIKWYRSQILGITRVNFDGSKLPQFNKEE